MTALIWCPFPDRDSARQIAQTLLDRKLIGCANLIGEVESIFEWKGEHDSATEIGVLFKTDSRLLDAAIQCLAEQHPYDIPAIIGWHCDSAADATRAWLGQLVQGDD